MDKLSTKMSLHSNIHSRDSILKFKHKLLNIFAHMGTQNNKDFYFLFFHKLIIEILRARSFIVELYLTVMNM